MNGLREQDGELLHGLQRNGGAGVIREGEVSAAIRLGVLGLARISKGEPQPIELTKEGRAWRPEFLG